MAPERRPRSEGERERRGGQNGQVTTRPAPASVRDRDLYAMLGVEPGATTEQITAAFRAKAKQLHPDRAPADPSADDGFKALSRAYSTLTRPRTRAAYDARRAQAAPMAPAGPVTRPARPEVLSTPRAARWAVWGGVVCILVGLAITPVLLTIPSGPDTVGRDVTLWIVVAKLLICGAILVGMGWWRLATLRSRSAPRPVATRR
jgi:DnaJ domain